MTGVSTDAVENCSADLIAQASATGLNEDTALALLKHTDLPADALERLSKNSAAMKSRKVKLALAEHPRTPRHVSMPMVRHLFTFDLMQLALKPVVPGDVKTAADQALINRLETITAGERLSLAHRGSGRIAAELLVDPAARVIQAALENSRLTEAYVIKAVMRADAPPALVQAVCQHAKWCLRREVRMALLRSQHTPRARAIEFAASFPLPVLRDLLHGSRLPVNVKEHLLQARSS
jgi:hypothetical protein